jgi:hypothetical protein
MHAINETTAARREIETRAFFIINFAIWELKEVNAGLSPER